MTAFDRVAWWCSWIAPVAWGIAASALVLHAGASGRVRDVAVPAFTMSAFAVAAFIAALATSVLTLHVNRARYLE
jgi:hypothetical protein